MKTDRKELYNLIWTHKLKGAAEQLKIKPTALSKICRQHDIPTPTSSYWTNLALGRPVEKPPLPNPENNYAIELEETINKEKNLKTETGVKAFNSGRYAEEVDAFLEREESENGADRPRLLKLAEQGKLKIDFKTDKKEAAEKIMKAVRAYPVPASLNSNRKIILDTRTYLSIERLDWRRRESHPLYGKLKKVLDIDVEEGNDIRALKIFDTLISILEALGGTMKIEPQTSSWDRKPTVVSFDGTGIPIRIVERLKRIKNTNPQYSFDGEYKFVKSGKLKIKIDNRYRECVVEDTDYEKLEVKMDKVASKIIEAVRYRKRQEEERRQRELEERRLAEIRRREEERRRELERLKAKEKEEIAGNLAAVKRFNLWKNIKTNIGLLEDEIMKYPDSGQEAESTLKKLKNLERLFNPLVPLPEESVLEEEDIEELAEEFYGASQPSEPTSRPYPYFG